jgi:hypothetical protein
MTKKSARKAIANIWMLTREYDSVAGAGGVKDVSRQLAEALVRLKKSVTVVLPCYGFLDPKRLGFTRMPLSFEVDMNYAAADRREAVTLWRKNLNGVKLYLVDADRYREKQSIYTYTAADEAKKPYQVQGDGHFDYFAMNVLLQKAALDLMIIKGRSLISYTARTVTRQFCLPCCVRARGIGIIFPPPRQLSPSITPVTVIIRRWGIFPLPGRSPVCPTI